MDKQYTFTDFVHIVKKLRSQEGCPWDRAQTLESLTPCLLNETAEAVAALAVYQQTKNPDNLCEELGDLLLQVVMQSQIAEEEGLFTMEDVIQSVSQKMIRRHPHVFGDSRVKEEAEVPGRWEAIKAMEKAGRPKGWEEIQKAALKEAEEKILEHFSKIP